MDSPLRSLDWSRVQTFLAVAEHGSLSAAARELRLSQPTLGRQIKAMEEELGVTLFTRQTRGLAVTEAGEDLLPAARAMAEAAHRLQLAAAGREEGLAGTVRITASHIVARHLLPDVITKIRRTEPEIELELSPTDSSENLLFRQADIALRMYRPEQLDMVARHLGELSLGLYACQDLVAAHGAPTSMEDVLKHDVIGYDRDDRILRGLRAFGIHVRREDFPLRCDDQNTYIALVQAGAGYGFVPDFIAERDPKLVRLLEDAEMPILPVWITAHEAIRRTPRVKRVWELLVQELKPLLIPPSEAGASRRAGEVAKLRRRSAQ